MWGMAQSSNPSLIIEGTSVPKPRGHQIETQVSRCVWLISVVRTHSNVTMLTARCVHNEASWRQ